MIAVQLPSEIEKYARKCVADGRFADLDEVLTTALELLRDHDQTKQFFMAMLDEAEAESEPDGWVSPEQMGAGLYRIIEDVEQRRRG
jgi:antitoxin ParD1/3/4